MPLGEILIFIFSVLVLSGIGLSKDNSVIKNNCFPCFGENWMPLSSMASHKRVQCFSKVFFSFGFIEIIRLIKVASAIILSASFSVFESIFLAFSDIDGYYRIWYNFSIEVILCIRISNCS